MRRTVLSPGEWVGRLDPDAEQFEMRAALHEEMRAGGDIRRGSEYFLRVYQQAKRDKGHEMAIQIMRAHVAAERIPAREREIGNREEGMLPLPEGEGDSWAPSPGLSRAALCPVSTDGLDGELVPRKFQPLPAPRPSPRGRREHDADLRHLRRRVRGEVEREHIREFFCVAGAVLLICGCFVACATALWLLGGLVLDIVIGFMQRK